MKKRYRVVIPPTAKESLRMIIAFIKKDSPTAATKVRKKLIDAARSLNVRAGDFPQPPLFLGSTLTFHR